jgi:hypothetical protein
MSDFKFPEVPTTIYCDNKSTLLLAANPEFHAKTKHINIKYHYIREEANAGRVKFIYVATDYNIADIFTKALAKIKFTTLRESMYNKDEATEAD